MPKAILEFNLPQENAEYKDAVEGSTYKVVIEDILNKLRGHIKYEDKETINAEEFRAFVYDTLRAYNLDLGE